MNFKDKLFEIKIPIFGVQKLYDWEKGVDGIGLLKDRIDVLADLNEIVYVSWGKDRQTIYTISAKKVQNYPLHDIPKWKGHYTYVVKSTDLNKSQVSKNDYEIKEMCENGTFG